MIKQMDDNFEYCKKCLNDKLKVKAVVWSSDGMSLCEEHFKDYCKRRSW